MKFRFISLEELKKTHYNVLRELARQFGIKSPTSKTKGEIIAEIMLIQKGERQPGVNVNNGAPLKSRNIKTDDIALAERLKQFIAPQSEDDDENVEKDVTDNMNEKVNEEQKAEDVASVNEEKVKDAETVPREKTEQTRPEPIAEPKTVLKTVNPEDEEYNVPRNNKIVLSDSLSNGEFSVEGILELHASGYGFLRAVNYESSDSDAYVSIQNIKKYNLRKGDKVKCVVKRIRENDSPALQEVVSINDLDPRKFLRRTDFDDLLPCYPTDKIKLEIADVKNDIAVRCIDLFAPIGMGQRGLIVAPPKTGKTTIIKKIAQSIEKNYPNVKLMVLLIDERPEEVTDMRRSVSGEVVYSTFDESPEHHIRAAELVISRAKRLVEVGQSVVILMDSITRLTRAYNNAVDSSGKTLSGGLDPAAMYGPKRFFGAARNVEGNGSLTILSTALIDTGSRMDDVIYEEFKGTGNMEIHLSRDLAEKRIFPAIDLYKSGTRKEELLLTEKELSAVYKLRKILMERDDATDSLIEMMKKTATNAEFVSKTEAWVKLYQK